MDEILGAVLSALIKAIWYACNFVYFIVGFVCEWYMLLKYGGRHWRVMRQKRRKDWLRAR